MHLFLLCGGGCKKAQAFAENESRSVTSTPIEE